jgi:hypothetical protein
MFFAHFVGDARSRESHQPGKWRVRPAGPARQRGNESAYRRLNARLPHPSVKRVCVSYLQNWQARQSGRPRRASPGSPGSLAAPGSGATLKVWCSKNARALRIQTKILATQTTPAHLTGCGPGDRRHRARRGYSLRCHRLAMAGRASGPALTARRFPQPWTVSRNRTATSL